MSTCCIFDSHYLVSDEGGCTNREAQTKHHTRSLGDETDQIKGGGRLVRRAGKTGHSESWAIYMLAKSSAQIQTLAMPRS